MKAVLGHTRRGQAVYSVHHDSYAQLERTRHLGSSPGELSQMARQAHPHFRAVDHEEAAQMHYAVGAFHAARAHEAASAAMAKAQVLADSETITVHKAMQMKPGQKVFKATPHLDPLASVYAAVGPQMTPQDAADIGSLLMPDWTPAQHREAGLAQQAIAQMFMGSDKEGHENQAMQAMAAAFVHLSAAGQMPADCIAPLGNDTPTFIVADDGSVSDAGVTKSTGVLGTTKGGRPVHIGDPLPEHKDKATSSLVAHGKHVAATHSSYSKQDHFDASFMHAKAAKAHGASTVEGRHHMAMANAHVFAAPLKKSNQGTTFMITLEKAFFNSFGQGIHKSTVSKGPMMYNSEAVRVLGQFLSKAKGIRLPSPAGASKSVYASMKPNLKAEDHHDLAIAHKTQAAVIRGKMRATPGASDGGRNKIAAMGQQATHHDRMAKVHYAASKMNASTLHVGTGSHADHLEAGIAHKTQAAIIRGKIKQTPGASDGGRAKIARMKNLASLHDNLAVAHSFAHAAQERTGLAKKSLSKAEKGEGSRGGKVVGHTKSGKPVYSRHAAENKSMVQHGMQRGMHTEMVRARVARAAHPDYTADDHHDAAVHHASKEDIKSISLFHQHRAAEEHMKDKSLNRKTKPFVAKSEVSADLSKAGGKGEGSRGGKVIGHTRSGKPIYSSSHASYSKIKHASDGLGDVMHNAEHVHSSEHHEKWTTADHYDAGQIHQVKAGDHPKSNAITAAHYLAGDFVRDHQEKNDGSHSKTAKGKLFSASTPAHKYGSGFTAKDHGEAANHYRQAADLHAKKGNKEKAATFNKLAKDHQGIADKSSPRKRSVDSKVIKSEAWMDLFKASGKGEGSRGGKIVGHTKSGKPIYAASGSKYKGMEAGPSIGSHNANRETYDERDKVNIRNAAHVQAKHPGYTAEDHNDAARFHEDDNNHHAAGAHHAAAGYYNHDFHSADVRAYSKEHVKANGSGGSEAKKETTAKKPRKPASGKRSIGWNVEKPKTDTGKAIPVDGSSKYKALDQGERQKAIHGDLDDRDAAGHRGPGWKMARQNALANKDADAMAHHFKGWSKQDHQDAADHHEDGNYHQASMAHQVLADRMDAKKSLRVDLDTLSLAKGFIVPPSTYFWGQPQHRVS